LGGFLSKELRDSLGRLRTEKEQLKQTLADFRPTIFQRRLRALQSRLERLQENGPLRRMRRIFTEKTVPASALEPLDVVVSS